MTHLREETIYCCDCEKHVHPMLVTGKDVYPHRKDLYTKLFWMCGVCECFVSCHPDSDRPLGCIAPRGLKLARHYIHQLLDPLWQYGTMTRSQAYMMLEGRFGVYHIANIRSLEEAVAIQEFLLTIPNKVKSIEGDFV